MAVGPDQMTVGAELQLHLVMGHAGTQGLGARVQGQQRIAAGAGEEERRHIARFLPAPLRAARRPPPPRCL
jgi:hypothetical protein